LNAHLLGWQESLDQAALGRIARIAGDDVLSVSGADRYQIPEGMDHIHWIAASGVNLTRARIVTPSLESRRMLLDVVPRQDAGNNFSLPSAEVMKLPRPIKLRALEDIEAQTAEDGATTQMQALALIGPAQLPDMPSGDLLAMRALGTTTLTAFEWTTVDVTLEYELPVGTYELVGFVPSSADVIAARALFQGGGYRPGVIGVDGAEDVAQAFGAEYFKGMMWYAMGKFTHQTVPQFQFFSGSADTAEVVMMYYIKTSDSVS
tara:strand:+ start:1122 stop:1907 length:786 start_codon:yes stop_codon:yes gene_type:complete